MLELVKLIVDVFVPRPHMHAIGAHLRDALLACQLTDVNVLFDEAATNVQRAAASASPSA